MLPTNDEFLLLYGAYLFMLIILVFGSKIGKRQQLFRKHLIAFAVYTGIMIVVFANEENFKYGSSLVVLFYGAVFVLAHFLILAIILIFKYFKKNRN